MSLAKEITIGFLVIGLVSIVFLGIAQEYSNKPRLGGSEVENIRENTATRQPASWWDNHDLHAIPGLENASVEDLPTAEEVENVLFGWPVFENKRPPLWIDRSGTYQEVLDILKNWNFEYHFDENDELVIDTPGVYYKKPGGSLPYWMIIHDNNTYRIWNYPGSRNSLDFSRYLNNLGIRNGIAIVFMDMTVPVLIEPKVVVPVQEGLAYYIPTNVDIADWTKTWYALNIKPNSSNPYYTDPELEPLGDIEIHWRLGEGEYVSWLYTLENGEPVMIYPENGEPVNW